MESNRGPTDPRRTVMCPSHLRWLGASCVKEWTLRTHRLWWKVSARSCSCCPESCKRKSLGGQRAAQLRTHSKQPCTLSCPHHQNPDALTSLPRHYRLQPQGGQGQVGQARTLLGTCTCRENIAVRHSPAQRHPLLLPGSAHHLVSGSTLTIRCRLRCRSQYSSSR